MLIVYVAQLLCKPMQCSNVTREKTFVQTFLTGAKILCRGMWLVWKDFRGIVTRVNIFFCIVKSIVNYFKIIHKSRTKTYLLQKQLYRKLPSPVLYIWIRQAPTHQKMPSTISPKRDQMNYIFSTFKNYLKISPWI